MLDKSKQQTGGAPQNGAKKPQGLPHYSTPALLQARPPRCPPFVEGLSGGREFAAILAA